MQQATQGAAPAPLSAHRASAPETTRRAKFGEPLYNEICDFLIEEANLLDQDLFKDWLGLLAEDILYTMPVRQTVFRRSGAGFKPSMNWLYEDRASLQFKVRRMLDGDSAWAEDPPSRTRRLITNVRVHETTVSEEYLAQSSVLLRRTRGDAHVADGLSARRDDIIRRTAEGLRLARRTVFMDQTVLGTPNLAVLF